MRNALDIRIIPHRTSRATAIATGQAIGFLENFGVSLKKLLVQVLRLTSH
jgi:hypothetical protein